MGSVTARGGGGIVVNNLKEFTKGFTVIVGSGLAGVIFGLGLVDIAEYLVR